MSHSSLPNPLPPALRQETLTKTLEVLRQPFALAVIASLGVHGLLWFGLPLLPQARTPEPDMQKTIGVVELSPTEQLRLPDFANPQVTFPPLTSQNRLPNPSTTPAPTRKQTQSSPSLFNDPLYNFPIVPPPPIVWNPELPNIFPGSLPREFVQPKPRVKPRSEVKPPVSPEPSPKTEEPTEKTPEAPPPAQVRPEKIPDQAIAALRTEQEKIRQQRDLFAFNEANTTEADQNKNLAAFGEFASNIAKDNLKQDSKTGWGIQDTVTSLYPKEACSFKVKGVALVAALVQPDGKLAEKPTVLRSSGYKPLDGAAIEYVSNQKFEPGEQYQIKTYPFEFKPTEATCPPDAAPKPPA